MEKELKTLKDLPKYVVNAYTEGFLEDVSFEDNEHESFPVLFKRKDLKQEAIKWARRENAMMISADKNQLMGYIGRFQVLCEFFNITEEDLK